MCVHTNAYTHIYMLQICILPTFTTSGILPSFLKIQFSSGVISFSLESNLPGNADLLVTDFLRFQLPEMFLFHLHFVG